jgi:hypothetical protein
MPNDTQKTIASAYANAPPLSLLGFAGFASRLAQKSSHWAADTIITAGRIEDPVRRDMADRYLNEMRSLLDHIDRQVKE